MMEESTDKTKVDADSTLNQSTALTKAAGATYAILGAAVTIFYLGLVISFFYSWFVVPVTGWPAIGPAQMGGIVMTGKLIALAIVGPPSGIGAKTEQKRRVRARAANLIITVTVIWIVGFIYYKVLL